MSGNLSVASNIIAGSGRTWNNSTGEVISKTTLRARVYFAGSASPTVYATYNGTLTRNGVGDYTLTFANTLPASVSSTACVIGNIALSTALGNQYLLYTYAKSTSAISFKIINPSGTAVDTPDMVEIIVFG